MVDPLAAMARQAHHDAQNYERMARQARSRRNDAVRRLHDDGGLSYTQITEQTGFSRPLVAKIIQNLLHGEGEDTDECGHTELCPHCFRPTSDHQTTELLGVAVMLCDQASHIAR